MASKSYGWDVRNIAKISPKMVKKGPFFDFRKKPKPTPLPHMRLWFIEVQQDGTGPSRRPAQVLKKQGS